MLTVAVVCASGWLGWLAWERSGITLTAPADEEPMMTPEEEATQKALEKLHATLGEAAISHREGDLDAATTRYQAALTLDPENAIAMRGLTAIAMTARDWKATRNALNRLAMVEPDGPDLPLQQALILNVLGKTEPSRAELRRFIDSTTPDDPRILPAAQVYLSLTRGE